MLDAGRQPINWPRTPWKQAIRLPGACQLQHCRMLMEARPYLIRIPDQSILKRDAGSGPDQIRCTRGSDGSYALIYIPSGQRVTIDMSRISGGKVIDWWYNPRTGEATRISEFEAAGNREFFTPNSDQTGRDWVLVLDDATKGYARPGV